MTPTRTTKPTGILCCVGPTVLAYQCRRHIRIRIGDDPPTDQVLETVARLG